MLIGVFMEEINKSKSFTPTQAMRNNAKRGLALREKWNRGGLSASQAKSEGVGSGVARARDIINGSLSLDTVKRMYAFFSRHQKNYAPSKKESDGGPTAGTIAWLLWGGSAGKAWSRSVLREQKLLKSVDKTLSLEDAGNLPITKAVNEELMQVTYVAMLPDSIDLHGDYTSEEEVRKAKESFNRSNMQANLFHVAMTDKFSVIESYLAPVDFSLDDKVITKGTWLMTLQVHDEDVWTLIKSGEINGISIGALASVETIEEDE
jgi:Putative phage serine protease XkdF